MQNLIESSILAAVKAGKEIMHIYEGNIVVELKDDQSPLTVADKKSNKIIQKELKIFDYPILSEEGEHYSYSQRKSWKAFWLIDPLDGTKEFIAKTGDFTVNIALIKDGVPILGVVYAPTTGTVYYGAEGLGSYTLQYDVNETLTIEYIRQKMETSVALPTDNRTHIYTIVASKSHSSLETEVFIESKKKTHGEVKLINKGSSLKLCLIAEGKANIYPRLAPTMEWDTAAGHAVAKYAKCNVYDFYTKQELVYNKENLLNPWFIVEQL